MLLPNDPDNYYRRRDIVPTQLSDQLGQAKILITNYHAFQLRERVAAGKITKSILADASISVNTRRAYLGALARVDAWRGDDPLTDGVLAAYLGAIFEAGRAPATAALAVAAVRFRAKLAGQADPAGERTARVLGGYRRTARMVAHYSAGATAERGAVYKYL